MSRSIKGVLIRDAAVLLCRNGRGEWELPGGRAEAPDADEAATVRRELAEEAGLTVTVHELLADDVLEVVQARFVRIRAYRLGESGPHRPPVASDEHREVRFVPLDALAREPVPQVYLGAIAAATARP